MAESQSLEYDMSGEAMETDPISEQDSKPNAERFYRRKKKRLCRRKKMLGSGVMEKAKGEGQETDPISEQASKQNAEQFYRRKKKLSSGLMEKVREEEHSSFWVKMALRNQKNSGAHPLEPEDNTVVTDGSNAGPPEALTKIQTASAISENIVSGNAESNKLAQNQAASSSIKEERLKLWNGAVQCGKYGQGVSFEQHLEAGKTKTELDGCTSEHPKQNQFTSGQMGETKKNTGLPCVARPVNGNGDHVAQASVQLPKKPNTFGAVLGDPAPQRMSDLDQMEKAGTSIGRDRETELTEEHTNVSATSHPKEPSSQSAAITTLEEMRQLESDLKNHESTDCIHEVANDGLERSFQNGVKSTSQARKTACRPPEWTHVTSASISQPPPPHSSNSSHNEYVPPISPPRASSDLPTHGKTASHPLKRARVTRASNSRAPSLPCLSSFSSDNESLLHSGSSSSDSESLPCSSSPSSDSESLPCSSSPSSDSESLPCSSSPSSDSECVPPTSPPRTSSDLPTHDTSNEVFRPPVEDDLVACNFRICPVIPERFIIDSAVGQFGIIELLKIMGWTAILSRDGPTYASIVGAFYASIVQVDHRSLTFHVKVRGHNEAITPEIISSILHVPLTPGGLTSIELPSSPTIRDEITTHLCGSLVPWKCGNALQASIMLPRFRILHAIFIYNVYPRKGNRDLTLQMAYLLYLVSTGRPICLPSLICHTIIQFSSSPGHGALPYGTLITALARNRFGVSAMPGERPIFATPFSQKNLSQMHLDQEMGHQQTVPIGVDKEASPSPPSAPDQPPTPAAEAAPSLLASQADFSGLKERLSSVETTLKEVRSELRSRTDHLMQQMSYLISIHHRFHPELPPPGF